MDCHHLGGEGLIRHQHPRPDDVLEGEAGLAQRPTDDREGRPSLAGRVAGVLAARIGVPETQQRSPTTIARL